MKKIFALFIFLIFCNIVQAQQHKMDSLLKKLAQAHTQDDIYPPLIELKAIPGGFLAAIKQMKQELARFENAGDQKSQERILLALCATMVWEQNFAGELQYALQGLHISRSINDNHYTASFLMEAAVAYDERREIRKAGDYYRSCTTVAITLRDTGLMLIGYSNLQTIYARILIKPDSALYFARCETRLCLHMDTAKHWEQIGTTSSDCGEAFASANKLDSALIYYRRSYNLYKKYARDYMDPELLDDIAQVYLKLNQPDSAMKYALNARSKAKDNNSLSFQYDGEAAGILSKLYEGRDYKKSFLYLKDQLRDKDSLDAQGKNKQLQLVADEDKEHEQDLVVAQDKFEATVRFYIVIGAAVLLLIVGLVLWRSYKRQKRDNRLLGEQKEEISAQRDELEDKNQELGIESALERIRTVAMGMIKPDDLLSICETMFNELEKLGFNDLRNAMINIHYSDKEYLLNYEFRESVGKTVVKVLYNSHPIVNNLVNHAQEPGEGFTEQIYTGKTLEEWKAFRKGNGEADDPRLDNISELYYYFYSIGTGSVGVSMFSAANAWQLEVLKRFRNVFDLAYKRYVDITNAELQVREAQIQLALERIRARTMAMQKSDELAETVSLLFKQLLGLGIRTEQIRTCGIVTFDDKQPVGEQWITETDGEIIPRSFMVRYDEAPAYKAIYKGWQDGEKFKVIHLEGQALKEHLGYLSKGTNVPIRDVVLPQQAVEIYNHVMYFSQGCLFIITKEALPGYHEIFKRFGAVFQQSYTRFLDLQKAEEQAREAQIQLALERVRARTMAMQRSEELQDAAALMFQQIEALGISTFSCGYNIFEMDDDVCTGWMSNHGQLQPPIKIPLGGNKTFANFKASKQNGEDFWVQELEGPGIRSHYQYLSSLPNGRAITTLNEQNEITLPLHQVNNYVNFSHGNLLFITYERVPGAHEIFKRFGKTFEQTYTRFLDLQKAEAQAREAKIEVALERVRASAMSMHQSQDINTAVLVVFEELEKLDLEILRCGIGIIDKANQVGDIWTTVKMDGKSSVQVSGKEPMNIHPLMQGTYDAWLNQTDFLYNLEGDDLMNYYRAVSGTNFNLPQSHSLTDENDGAKQYYYTPTFKTGNLYAFRESPFPDAAKSIMKRFASVLNLTFSRFLDLQKAEVQTREAQIETALERVRSRTTAMRNSDELADVLQIIFHQFVYLDVPLSSAGFVINTPDTKDQSLWVALRDTTRAVPLTVPYIDIRLLNLYIEAREKGIKFYPVKLSKAEKDVIYTHLLKHNPGISKERGEAALNAPGYADSHVLTEDVTLYIQNFTGIPFSDEENAILVRFGNAFQQIYTRFTDLKKSEEQTKEAQIEAALEKVRSRTLAMQRSDELAETAAVLFRQMMGLGIEPNRLYIGIARDETTEIEFWVTDEDGSKVSTMFSGDASQNKSIKKMYDSWKAHERSLVIDMHGKELTNYLHYLGDVLHVPFEKGLSQKRRVQYISFFSGGFIGMASPDEQPKATIDLLDRFAYVFNLTFARFNDLKLAEIQAVQAAEDLVKLQTEKKRAEDALTDLRAAQKQLVQSEKMASLGELTAGIAHEIQNPLNFVNNFSEVNQDLLRELKAESEKPNAERDEQLETELINDLIGNEEKINHHGKRADAIVKGMLEHSRSSTGQKEPTDLNKLADEYLRLAYHGLRAKDKSFNSDLVTHFDEQLPLVDVVPQDIGRVLLNLFTNAFYAVNQKKKTAGADYKPAVEVTTFTALLGGLGVSVRDNGPGIPDDIKDKIMQPFFTTKPTGEGTGLGLSLSYDIVVKGHGGSINVASEPGHTEFTVILSGS